MHFLHNHTCTSEEGGAGRSSDSTQQESHKKCNLSPQRSELVKRRKRLKDCRNVEMYNYKLFAPLPKIKTSMFDY